MSLSRYIEAKLGFKTRSVQNPVVTAVPTTVTMILKNNPDRVGYTIVNLGAKDLHVAFDNEVSTSRGILISAAGGSLTLSADEDGEICGYALYGISTDAQNNIYSIETEGE